MNDNVYFGDKIVSLRESMGLTRSELAERSGIEYQTLAKYETNKRMPGPEVINLLARFFGVTTDYLLGNNESPVPYEKRPQDLRKFIDQGELHLDGEPLTDADREKLHKVIGLLFWEAKQQNKRKKS